VRKYAAPTSICAFTSSLSGTAWMTTSALPPVRAVIRVAALTGTHSMRLAGSSRPP